MVQEWFQEHNSVKDVDVTFKLPRSQVNRASVVSAERLVQSMEPHLTTYSVCVG